MTIPRPEPRGQPGNLGAPFTAHAAQSRTALIDLRDPAAPREYAFRDLDAAPGTATLEVLDPLDKVPRELQLPELRQEPVPAADLRHED